METDNTANREHAAVSLSREKSSVWMKSSRSWNGGSFRARMGANPSPSRSLFAEHLLVTVPQRFVTEKKNR